MIIAIHPDDYTHPSREPKSDSASYRWAQAIEKAGHEVRWVNVRAADILDQLAGCHGFMWRWNHSAGMARIARRLLPVIERELKIPVYPDQHTCWHYDDKIAQAYLFQALGIPSPKTWVWYDRQLALEWAEKAGYPVVLKLATGAGSQNVVLVSSREEACRWIDRLFRGFYCSLEQPNLKQRVRLALNALLLEDDSPFPDNGYDPQAGYVLFQEFLPGNAFDTRITVIGNRAFGFRRFNRNNDFRASGSGHLSYDIECIPEEMIRLAFSTAQKLRMQSCAIDGLYRGKTPLVGEASYTFVSSAVHDCPGHWKLNGSPETGSLIWNEGHLWPEEAQIEDFLALLHNR